jgi:hypothetical protein
MTNQADRTASSAASLMHRFSLNSSRTAQLAAQLHVASKSCRICGLVRGNNSILPLRHTGTVSRTWQEGLHDALPHARPPIPGAGLSAIEGLVCRYCQIPSSTSINLRWTTCSFAFLLSQSLPPAFRRSRYFSSSSPSLSCHRRHRLLW